MSHSDFMAAAKHLTEAKRSKGKEIGIFRAFCTDNNIETESGDYVRVLMAADQIKRKHKAGGHASTRGCIAS